MKKCSTCKELKPFSDFNKDKSRKEGIKLSCKICSRKNFKRHYERNREFYLDKAKRVKNKIKDDIKRIKEENPCADCGIFYPYYVMDFDHLNSTNKQFCIGQFGFHGKKQILDEIDKCELVCSNCHRIRSHNRQSIKRSHSPRTLRTCRTVIGTETTGSSPVVTTSL